LRNLPRDEGVRIRQALASAGSPYAHVYGAAGIANYRARCLRAEQSDAEAEELQAVAVNMQLRRRKKAGVKKG